MKWQGDECSIPRAQFRALLEFACKDETREGISKICFDPARARVSATDGHTLLVLEDTQPQDQKADAEPWCVDLGDAKSLSKMASAKINICLRWCDGSVLATSAGVDLKFDAADPVFPPFDQIIPERVSSSYNTKPTGFDALYLQRIAIVAKALQEDRHDSTSVRMQPGTGPLDPVRFDFDERPNQLTRAVIVIMPMHLP